MVEVDPAVFDDLGAAELLERLIRHFSGVSVSLITPDWEADEGFRIAGLAAPIDIIAASDLIWRELMLPSNEELPF